MVERQVFEQMISVYSTSISEMKLVCEFDWCDAASETRKRLNLYLNGAFKNASIQLARECHADLQGYIQVRYGSDIMDIDCCREKGCFDLYVLGQRLVQIGGYP